MKNTVRRDYGEGSVYRRKSDGLWVGTVEAGWTAKGTRRRLTVYAKTRADAKRKLRDKRLAVEREGVTEVSARDTVRTWADRWLELEQRRLAPNSYNATETAVNRWIIPAIGHKKFDALTPGDVRAVSERQREAGLAGSTQVRTHSALKSLLRAAEQEGYRVPARVLNTSAPSGSKSDRSDLGLPEALLVLEQASYLPHGSRYVAALLQGLRQGEALGMEWDRIDFDRNLMTVDWQLQPLKYRVARDRSSGFRVPDGYEARQLKGALHLVRPKSDAGWRVIPMVPWFRDALAHWREIAPDSPHGLVWPNPDGSPTYYKADDATWYGLQDAADVRHPKGRYYTIHENRHTTVTLLLEAGVDPAVIIAIVGHSSFLSTRAYQHVKQEQALAALAGVAERLQLR
jgi:integrase